jgi:hypothetical protein
VWDEKERPEAEQVSIKCRKIGCASLSAIYDQDLLFHQPAISNDGACAVRSKEFCIYGQ